MTVGGIILILVVLVTSIKPQKTSVSTDWYSLDLLP